MKLFAILFLAFGVANAKVKLTPDAKTSDCYLALGYAYSISISENLDYDTAICSELNKISNYNNFGGACKVTLVSEEHTLISNADDRCAKLQK